MFLLLLLLLHFIPPTQSLGLATVLLVSPRQITVGVTTKITVIGDGLGSKDKIRLATDPTCTTLLSTASPHLSERTPEQVKNNVQPTANLLVQSIQGKTTSSYVCLQVHDGASSSPFLYTGATIIVNPTSTLTLIRILHAQPSNWMIAPLQDMSLRVSLQGYGLLDGVSAALSATDSCATSADYISTAVLSQVTEDATLSVATFLVSLNP